MRVQRTRQRRTPLVLDVKAFFCNKNVSNSIKGDLKIPLPILKDKLINEINLIPDEYNFVRYFRLGVEKTKTNENKEDTLSYCGSWKDINIDEFISDIAKRRSNTFRSRRDSEAVSH